MFIREQVMSAMIDHARRDNPIECCGLLAGRGDTIDECVCTTNVRASRTAYQIDPVEHLKTMRRVREDGRSILGAYHSHPRSRAVPSPTDIAEAYYPEFLYVIVSLEQSAPEVCAYLIDAGNFRPVPLVTVPG